MSRKAKNIEAIIFDAYGTLFDLDSFASECNELIQGKGDEVLEIVKQKQLEYVLTRSLVNKYKDYASITKSAIKFALEKMGHLNTDVSEEIENLYNTFLRLEPFEDVETTLNDLDQVNARVLLLSNGTQEMLDKVVEHAGFSLLKEEVVSVEGTRTYKPDPRSYHHALDHLQIFEKERLLYISGNTWDVAGAKAFGLKVAWVNRSGQPSFDEELLDLRPDYEFTNLGQIKSLFMTRDSEALELP